MILSVVEELELMGFSARSDGKLIIIDGPMNHYEKPYDSRHSVMWNVYNCLYGYGLGLSEWARLSRIQEVER